MRERARTAAVLLLLAALLPGCAAGSGLEKVRTAAAPNDPNTQRWVGTVDCGQPLRPFLPALGTALPEGRTLRLAVIGDSTLAFTMYWRRLLRETYDVSENTRIGADVSCLANLFADARREADVVLVGLGTNDGHAGLTGPERATIERALAVFEGTGTPVMWIAPFIHTGSSLGVVGKEGVREVAQLLIDHDRDPADPTRFRRGNELIVLPWNRVASEMPRQWMPDGIHPTAYSDKRAMAEAIVPQVELYRMVGLELDGGGPPWTPT